MPGPLMKQSWAMSAVLVNMFGVGMLLSYPSCLMDVLTAPDSPIKVDIHTASWLSSTVGLSGIPGFLTSSYLMDVTGRRITQGLMIVPALIGWLCIYLATNVETLMIGMFCGGFTLNGTVSLGAVIIGEYSSPSYRGVFLYLKNASVLMGALVMHILAQVCYWRTIALIGLIPHFLALVVVYTWPESPAWLMTKRHYEQSETSFYWLRGNNEASQRELEDTIKAHKERTLKPKCDENYCGKIMNFFKKFTEKVFLKPFFIVILSTVVLEMSGRHIFPAYGIQIISSVTGKSVQNFYYTLSIDLIIVSSALFASVLVKKINRRTLLFSTGFSAFAVLMIACIYLTLASRDIIPKDKPWIPTSLLILYFVLANLGCAPIPLALVGEVFPLAHRGQGLAVSGVWFAICLMIALKSTPHMLITLQAQGFFAVFGSIMFISLLILYFILPETKDKTLQEIENYFNNGKYTKEDNDEEANVNMIKS